MVGIAGFRSWGFGFAGGLATGLCCWVLLDWVIWGFWSRLGWARVTLEFVPFALLLVCGLCDGCSLSMLCGSGYCPNLRFWVLVGLRCFGFRHLFCLVCFVGVICLYAFLLYGIVVGLFTTYVCYFGFWGMIVCILCIGRCYFICCV